MGTPITQLSLSQQNMGYSSWLEEQVLRIKYRNAVKSLNLIIGQGSCALQMKNSKYKTEYSNIVLHKRYIELEKLAYFTVKNNNKLFCM